jgi:hypothetical protein
VVEHHRPARDAGGARVVIRVSHVSLPDGLSAIASRGPDGGLTVYVSDALPPDRQRAAVRAALRASRRAGWRGAALLPVPLLAFAALRRPGALVRAPARVLARALTTHTTWFAAGTAAVVGAAAAALYIAVVPHGQPAGAPRIAAPSVQPVSPGAPGPHGGHSSHRSGPVPVAAHSSGSPGGLLTPVPTGTSGSTAAATPSPGSAPSPTPAPSPSSPGGTSPPPSPSPSPSPSPTHTGPVCIDLLVIGLCL